MEKSKQIERYCHDSSKDIGEKPAQEPGIYVKPAVVKLISRQTTAGKESWASSETIDVSTHGGTYPLGPS